MKLHRALLLGAIAGAAFTVILELVRLVTPSNGIYAGVLFVLFAPIFDRIALRFGGDSGPRVFWSAACWMVFPLAFTMVARPASGEVAHFGVVRAYDEVAAVVFATLGALTVTYGRRAGLHSALLRRLGPWMALVGTIASVCFLVSVRISPPYPQNLHGYWTPPAALPQVAATGMVLGLVLLFFRARGLIRLRGLDEALRAGTMTVDGLVTVDGLPPMHAPTGIIHFAGPVLVQLDEPSAATFRATGAPKIIRLLQGMDADLDGRRNILDEGARALATAAILLSGVATYAALVLYLLLDRVAA